MSGPCNATLATTGHTGVMNVALGDGSVRGLSADVTSTTYWAAITPAGGETLGPDF